MTTPQLFIVTRAFTYGKVRLYRKFGLVAFSADEAISRAKSAAGSQKVTDETWEGAPAPDGIIRF